MSAKKVKALILVSALLFGICLTTTGCKQKKEEGWVNTASLPGQTFKSKVKKNTKKQGSTIVYLGSSYESKNEGFGPKDISFEFKNLK